MAIRNHQICIPNLRTVPAAIPGFGAMAARMAMSSSFAAMCIRELPQGAGVLIKVKDMAEIRARMSLFAIFALIT